MTPGLALAAADGRVLGNGFWWHGCVVTPAHVARRAAGHALVVHDGASATTCTLAIVRTDDAADLAMCVPDTRLPPPLASARIIEPHASPRQRVRIEGLRPVGRGRFAPVAREGWLEHVRVPRSEGGGLAWVSDIPVFPGDSGSLVVCMECGASIGIVLGNPRFSPAAALVGVLHPWINSAPLGEADHGTSTTAAIHPR